MEGGLYFFKCKIELIPTEQGGRRTPIFRGEYRPILMTKQKGGYEEYREGDKLVRRFPVMVEGVGCRIYPNREVRPGQFHTCPVGFLRSIDVEPFENGSKPLLICEGSRVVIVGTLLAVLGWGRASKVINNVPVLEFE